MRNRLITLVIALLLGGVAVMLVYLYVNRVEEETTAGQELVTVLVSTRFLPAGTSGNDIVASNAFKVEQVPTRYALPGALTDPAQMQDQVLADDIAAGEQISSQRFAATETDAFLAEIPPGDEALSLPFEYIRGVAGHVRAGDDINVYVTARAKKALARLLRRLNIPSSARVFAPKEGVTALLYEGVPVVEVQGLQPTETGQVAATGLNLTLAVSGQQAATLIHAQQVASLWYTVAAEDGRS